MDVEDAARQTAGAFTLCALASRNPFAALDSDNEDGDEDDAANPITGAKRARRGPEDASSGSGEGGQGKGAVATQEDDGRMDGDDGETPQADLAASTDPPARTATPGDPESN